MRLTIQARVLRIEALFAGYTAAQRFAIVEALVRGLDDGMDDDPLAEPA